VEHGGDAVGAGFGGEVTDAEGYVVADRHVGEEAGLLGEESDGAAAWGDGDLAFGLFVLGFEEGAAC
jgi:hypothetical protein